MNTENTTEQTATAMPRPCGKVMSEAEMGVAWDRKMGDTIWFAGIKQAGYLYTESEVRAALAAQQPAAIPPAVIAWRDAYGKYVAALDVYNSRVTAIREREKAMPHTFGEDNPHAEWDAWNKAEREARALVPAMYEALAAAPAVPSNPPVLAANNPLQQPAAITPEKIESLIAPYVEPDEQGAYCINHGDMRQFASELLALVQQPAASGEPPYLGPLRTPAGDPAWIPRATPPQVGQPVRVLMDAGRVANPRHPGYPDGKWEEVSEARPAGGLGGVAFLCELTQTGCVTHWMPLPAGPAGTTGGAQA